VPVEEGTVRRFRNFHEITRSFKIWTIRAFANIDRHLLLDILLIVFLWRHRQRFGFRHFGQHDPETDEPALVFWQRSHTIGRTQVIREGAVTAAAGYLKIAIDSADRIDLVPGFVGAIPVVAPLFHVAVHIVEAPRISRRFANVEGDNFLTATATNRIRIPTVVRVFNKFFRQRIAGGKLSVRSRPAGIFPLGFGRQAVGQAFFFR